MSVDDDIVDDATVEGAVAKLEEELFACYTLADNAAAELDRLEAAGVLEGGEYAKAEKSFKLFDDRRDVVASAIANAEKADDAKIKAAVKDKKRAAKDKVRAATKAKVKAAKAKEKTAKNKVSATRVERGRLIEARELRASQELRAAECRKAAAVLAEQGHEMESKWSIEAWKFLMGVIGPDYGPSTDPEGIPYSRLAVGTNPYRDPLGAFFSNHAKAVKLRTTARRAWRRDKENVTRSLLYYLEKYVRKECEGLEDSKVLRYLSQRRCGKLLFDDKEPVDLRGARLWLGNLSAYLFSCDDGYKDLARSLKTLKLLNKACYAELKCYVSAKLNVYNGLKGDMLCSDEHFRSYEKYLRDMSGESTRVFERNKSGYCMLHYNLLDSGLL